MEEDIRKQGVLHLQQQRFGKKWKRVWCVLFRESSCSISRLEFFECKDGGNDKSLRKQQEHKKVIRLTDCIRVSELEMDGCPRDTGPFLVETTEKIYVFAADRVQLEDWTHKLCEIAFPMSWMDGGVKRGSLQRGHRVEDDEGSEDNSLYSGRETVRDFRVCVRRTEASDRCRLRSDVVLRVDPNALKLLSPNGGAVYEWPYQYLRRFGRDKSTFSFEAGRRCDSGEGSFEFDTRQGNSLFQAVEAAINMQRISLPHRQTSGGGQGLPDSPQGLAPSLSQSRTLPLPQPRGHVPQSPAAAQALDGVYSIVTCEPANLHMIHHMDRESNPPQQQRPLPEAHLQLPVDKTLTGVKSLTLDTRSLVVPRKNQVKMISSCPLPHAGPDPVPAPAPAPRPNPTLSASTDASQTYSQITLSAAKRSTRREKRSDAALSPPLIAKEPEYSLPFDIIAKNLTDAGPNCPQAPGSGAGVDPLYDSIDEMKIRNVFTSEAAGRVEHIYDEPEGCAAAGCGTGGGAQNPAGDSLVYDDPEEMRGDAWRIMGTAGDPRGHEYPYNPRLDDYAVPKRPQRACPAAQSTTEEEREHEGVQPRGEGEERHDSPYNNVTVKMA